MPINLKQLFSAPINNVPPIANQKYFPALDGFRGLAILLLISGHFFFGNAKAPLLGFIGVEIFFVLSGFLITTLLLKELLINGNINLKHFYIRRGLRIVPVSYLFLILLAIANICFNLKIGTLSFLASFLYFRNIPFNYGENFWPCAHFWTLAVEEQFYLIFAFILVKSVNKYLKVALLIILVVPVLQFFGQNNIGVFYSNFWLHKINLAIILMFGGGTIAILIGSVMSILMFKGILRPLNPRKTYFLSFFILIAALIFRLFYPPILIRTYINQGIFSVMIAAVIFLCLPSADFLSKLLSNRLLTKIGVLSYSIYIWQQLFVNYQPWQHTFKYADAWWLNIPALMLVSYLSYHYFEKRFLKLKDKFKAV